MKVLGMGNALVDVLTLIEDDISLEQMGLPKGSMQLIDEAKLDLLSVTTKKFETHIASGGSASNTITSLARLGVETGFIGKVGSDFYGDHYKADINKYGVKSHLIEVNARSGVAMALISKDGERTFGTYLGAAASLNPEDLDEAVFDEYDYLYVEGYLVQNLALIRKGLKIAKEKGLKVALDLASYNIVEENREFLLEIIPEYVDILFANRKEMKALLGLTPEESLTALANKVEIVVIKVGSKGSWIQRGTEKIFVPTLDIKRVDTTGAGDLYAAGFLYGLLNNYSLEACGEMGTLLAQEVIQVVGAKLDEKHWVQIKKVI